LKRIERDLEDILKVVKEWKILKVEYKRAFIRTLTPHQLGNMFNPSFSSRSLTFFGTSEIML
jgi:hypothetical protein